MTAVTHHIALRVDDIDRAARFYIDVFDGYYLTLPKRASGKLAASTATPNPRRIRSVVPRDRFIALSTRPPAEMASASDVAR